MYLHLCCFLGVFCGNNTLFMLFLFYFLSFRRFGTWTVAKLVEKKSNAIVEGPICNGTQVIGWHVNESVRKFRRFHADLSGFAFNSTILWDPKRWHRPTLEPIRHLDKVKDGFQVSILCLSFDSSIILLCY